MKEIVKFFICIVIATGMFYTLKYNQRIELAKQAKKMASQIEATSKKLEEKNEIVKSKVIVSKPRNNKKEYPVSDTINSSPQQDTLSNEKDTIAQNTAD